MACEYARPFSRALLLPLLPFRKWPLSSSIHNYSSAKSLFCFTLYLAPLSVTRDLHYVEAFIIVTMQAPCTVTVTGESVPGRCTQSSIPDCQALGELGISLGAAFLRPDCMSWNLVKKDFPSGAPEPLLLRACGSQNKQ